MSTSKSTALQVQWWPLDRPIPYARNARVCPATAVAKVAGSIHEFGFKNPILVDGEGVIIAGHTRLLAAQRLELKTVPVIVCADLSPAKVKALRLADNRTGEETTWDEQLLVVEIGELLGLDIDLSLTGFDEEEIAALLAEPTEGLTDEDEGAPVPEIPASRTGDLWLLGKHRLLCGDSTSSDDVKRLMDGKRAVLMATDPPYLVDYDGGSHLTTKGGGPAQHTPAPAAWDHYIDHESSTEFYVGFLRAALEQALTDSAAVYQCFAIMRADIVLASWREVGLLPHQVLIWKKSRRLLTHAHYMWDYEPFVYGWPQGNMPKRRPPAEACTVWEIGSAIEDAPGAIHPTMKPVELIRRPITYHTKPGGLIYEPFSGSGTAIIAAENTGRVCCAMEQSPAFVDAAVARWEAYTGEEATLEGDGRSFAAVAAERLP